MPRYTRSAPFLFRTTPIGSHVSDQLGHSSYIVPYALGIIRPSPRSNISPKRALEAIYYRGCIGRLLDILIEDVKASDGGYKRGGCISESMAHCRTSHHDKRGWMMSGSSC